MTILNFLLPESLRHLDQNNEQDVLFLAERVALVCVGAKHSDSPPEIRKDGSVSIYPNGNDFWLYPPGRFSDQPEGHWRLSARYDNKEKLEAMILRLDQCG